MNKENQAMDEYTLAAFMAGTLPPDRREEVALYLSNNADARELLQMAYEALEASRAQDTDFELPEVQIPAPARVRHDRKPTQLGRRMHSGIVRFAAAAVVFFVVGMGLRVTLGPPTDALRSRQADDVLALSVATDGAAGPVVHWNQVPDAYQYRVVFWDPMAAEVVGRVETSATRIDHGDEFIESIRARGNEDRSYTVRVDAYDVQNRLIQTSETVSLTLSP